MEIASSIMVISINWNIKENNDRKILWFILSILLLGIIGVTIFYFLAKKTTKKEYNLDEIDYSVDYSYLENSDNIVKEIIDYDNESIEEDLNNIDFVSVNDQDINLNKNENTNGNSDLNKKNNIYGNNTISAREFKEELDIIRSLCGEGIISTQEADKKIRELKDKFLN